MAKNFKLEHCLQKLEKGNAKSLTDISLEVYAVNNLKDKKDILSFYRAYLKHAKEKIESDVNKKKINHAVKLVKRGYSSKKVAAFFVYDGLMYALGHIYDQTILKDWYSVLPYMNRGFPKEMYEK